MLTVLSLLCPDYESRNYSKFKIPFSFSVILLHYLFVFGEPMYLHLNDMHPNPIYIYSFNRIFFFLITGNYIKEA